MYHSVKLDMCMHGRKLTVSKFNFSPSLPNASSCPVTPAPSPPRQFRISFISTISLYFLLLDIQGFEARDPFEWGLLHLDMILSRLAVSSVAQVRSSFLPIAAQHRHVRLARHELMALSANLWHS